MQTQNVQKLVLRRSRETTTNRHEYIGRYFFRPGNPLYFCLPEPVSIKMLGAVKSSLVSHCLDFAGDKQILMTIKVRRI